MVTLSTGLQAPVQALMRPSVWLPCCNRLHQWSEIWNVSCSSNELVDAILEAIRSIQRESTETWDVHKVCRETGFMRLFVFTRLEWLDVIEISPCGEHSYQVVSFSSGFLPLFVPFACVINLALFWVPFYDMRINERRTDLLRSSINLPISLQDS
ncbi:uncharacterized protein LOC127871785 [Dreissena polymorpha]|uniref:Uncharacterized protein n=1 Tax=Dreissena polymorpha TaxID=45954 RepID=A0A9D4MKP1_DREPO|nr:uncharacterized protein LOC127871785 [Dreissena polymorpha]XP_052270951.1 uncharacterized protein LOC127871785 [Dreissena polymorpha]KAH3877434.1 hypothetical protein DPMN_001301 [Dreissena polymorpha]